MDLIDREAAIKALTSGVILVTNDSVDAVKKVMELFIDKIKNLPAAQPDTDEWCTDCSEYDSERHCCPRWNRVIRETLKDAQQERKTSKWLRIKGEQEYVCQECGQRCLETIMLLPKWDYCPLCGAYMGGEQDG